MFNQDYRARVASSVEHATVNVEATTFPQPVRARVYFGPLTPDSLAAAHNLADSMRTTPVVVGTDGPHVYVQATGRVGHWKNQDKDLGAVYTFLTKLRDLEVPGWDPRDGQRLLAWADSHRREQLGLEAV